VDDGSSDATEDVVRKFGDQRVRYIRQEHSGAGAARNRGTLEARHELVAYLDSDDEWIRGKTALQRGFFYGTERRTFLLHELRASLWGGPLRP